MDIRDVPPHVRSAVAAQQVSSLAFLLPVPCPTYGESGQILTPLVSPQGSEE